MNHLGSLSIDTEYLADNNSVWKVTSNWNEGEDKIHIELTRAEKPVEKLISET